MENLRHRSNVKQVNDKKKLSKNEHQNQTICHTKYATIIKIRKSKLNLKLNKPA